MEYNLSLPEDRYGAIEEIRTLLGFTKTEWRVLLHAISKTDNGWLQFAFGSVTVDFKKFVDEINFTSASMLEKTRSLNSQLSTFMI